MIRKWIIESIEMECQRSTRHHVHEPKAYGNLNLSLIHFLLIIQIDFQFLFFFISIIILFLFLFSLTSNSNGSSIPWKNTVFILQTKQKCHTKTHHKNIIFLIIIIVKMHLNFLLYHFFKEQWSKLYCIKPNSNYRFNKWKINKKIKTHKITHKQNTKTTKNSIVLRIIFHIFWMHWIRSIDCQSSDHHQQM